MALNIQKTAPELLQQVAQGKVKLRDAAKKVSAASPPPAKPALGPQPTKRQHAIDTAAKRRMIEAISQIGGMCEGLSGLKMINIQRISTAQESATWAAIAHKAAKELRVFGTKLKSTQWGR
jgi:hypothetical protein